MHVSAAGRTLLLKGLLPSCTFSSLSLSSLCLADTGLVRFPPPFSSWPLPQLWKWTLRYGYEGEDEVRSKFPARLSRQPPGSVPTLSKSSVANQNSCWEPPDPEFPDKEMFMLSFFYFFAISSTREWLKKKSPTLDMRVAAGMYRYVHHIVCCLTSGGVLACLISLLTAKETCWLQVFPPVG